MSVNCINKKIGTIKVYMLAFMLLFTGCAGTGGDSTTPKAVEGLLDLAGWDFDIQGTVELDGDWEFYANSLYTPADFNAQVPGESDKSGGALYPGSSNHNPAYLPVNTPLSVPGYATFRLQLKGIATGRPLALKIGYVSNAYTLWAGELVVAQAGETGPTASTAVPAGKMCKEIYFITGAECTELVLQISSFQCTQSGLKNSIMLGSIDKVNILYHRELSLGFLLLGCLGLILLFRLFTFFFSGRRRADLFFALFVFFFAVQFLFNDFTLSSYFPVLDLGYECGVKLLMLSSGFAFISFFLYAVNLVKKLPRSFAVTLLRNIFLLLAGLHTLLSLFVNIEAGILITTLYETFIFPAGMLLILIELIINRQSRGLGILICGFVILTVLSVTDIILQNFVLDDFNLIPWGIILFFFFNLLYEQQNI